MRKMNSWKSKKKVLIVAGVLVTAAIAGVISCKPRITGFRAPGSGEGAKAGTRGERGCGCAHCAGVDREPPGSD